MPHQLSALERRNGGLRLSIDYRGLNRKTVRDRHPILRIQETLDNIGGSSWFSVFDQGKAYHQGFIEKNAPKQNDILSSTGQKIGRIAIFTTFTSKPTCCNEQTSHGGETNAAEFQEPVEPVEKSSERNLPDSGETHERPTRQRRAPTMLTYDTLGIPSFYPRTTNHTVGVTPSAPTFRGTVVGPPSYTGLNFVWPWAYPVSYGPVGAYPYCTN